MRCNLKVTPFTIYRKRSSCIIALEVRPLGAYFSVVCEKYMHNPCSGFKIRIKFYTKSYLWIFKPRVMISSCVCLSYVSFIPYIARLFDWQREEKGKRLLRTASLGFREEIGLPRSPFVRPRVTCEVYDYNYRLSGPPSSKLGGSASRGSPR